MPFSHRDTVAGAVQPLAFRAQGPCQAQAHFDEFGFLGREVEKRGDGAGLPASGRESVAQE